MKKMLVSGVSLGSSEEPDWQEFLYKNVGVFLLSVQYFRSSFLYLQH